MGRYTLLIYLVALQGNTQLVFLLDKESETLLPDMCKDVRPFQFWYLSSSFFWDLSVASESGYFNIYRIYQKNSDQGRCQHGLR